MNCTRAYYGRDDKRKPTPLFRLVVDTAASALVSNVDGDTPHMIDDDERRRQRGLFTVFFRQTVTIEAPRLHALLLHHLKRVAACENSHFSIKYFAYFRILNITFTRTRCNVDICILHCLLCNFLRPKLDSLHVQFVQSRHGV